MTQSKEEQCPICSKSFPVSQLYKHVNSCLDNQESKKSPSEEASEDTSGKAETPALKKRNTLSALGLKADTSSLSQKKVKKTETKKPSLTSKLLEQKRLQAEIRKRDKEIPLEEQFKAIAEDAMTQSRTQEKPLANDIEETKLQKESKFLQKAKEIKELKRQASIPLAHRLRPKSLDDFFGQEKLVG